MSLLTVTNLLLLFSVVAYCVHSYWHNTIDLMYYRARLTTPVASFANKYIYINSFFLFIISTLTFIVSVVLQAMHNESPRVHYSVFALSVLLTMGAVRLITLPHMRFWRMRAK